MKNKIETSFFTQIQYPGRITHALVIHYIGLVIFMQVEGTRV
jgi:hypothetical protein